MANIIGSTFIGFQYDAKAVKAIETVAEGLLENAKALGKLAGVLRASNVHIDTLVKVNDTVEVGKQSEAEEEE